MTTDRPRELPPSLVLNPRVSQWLRFDPAGYVELRPGKVELGQGLATALAQLAADELGVDLGRVRVVPASTRFSPDEGLTSGSRSIEESGAAVRKVCAEARRKFLAAASEELRASGQELRIDDGDIVGSVEGRTSYWELAATVALDFDVAPGAEPLPLGSGRSAGRSSRRTDLEAKVRGGGNYIHNLVLPDMLHARVVRPPYRHGRLVDLPYLDLDGVTLVRDGSFLGVLAEDEAAAVRAMERVAAAATWETVEPLPSPDGFTDHMRTAPADDHTHLDVGGENPVTGRVVSATYSRPFIAHASMGPSCSVAKWGEDGLQVWCSTQGVYNIRNELARALDVEVDFISVDYMEGSGCYGHNGSDDATYEACLLARHAGGRPVRLQWTRADELGWAPYGPAAVADLEAALDDDGRIVSWSCELWTYGSRGRPGYTDVGPAFWAASQLADPFPRDHSHLGGATRNIEPGYDIPAMRIRTHLMTDTSIRSSSLRSLGAHLNVFAIESMMDELADEAGADPVVFRLRHLTDERGRAVVERVAEEVGWGNTQLPESHGRGIGYARYKGSAGYCAVVAEVEATTRLRVAKLTIAVDVGFVVNPDGVANQVAGGAIQATSWTTAEQVRFSSDRILTTDWEEYPIIKFSEVPEITVVTIDRPDHPPLGAGELAQGPTAAAIANALTAAIGIRVRDMPLTYERIVAAVSG